MQKLPKRYHPTPLTLSLASENVEKLTAAHAELSVRAAADPNNCYGFFPAFKSAAIKSDLPACKLFANAMPEIELEGKRYGFNFIRLSVRAQPNVSPYHLDSDAGSAVGGSLETIFAKNVWRVLVNVHPSLPRTVGYLDIDANSLPLIADGGYVHCNARSLGAASMKQITLGPRLGEEVAAVVFCANRVLHSGSDTQQGHFVLGYGLEEKVGV